MQALLLSPRYGHTPAPALYEQRNPGTTHVPGARSHWVLELWITEPDGITRPIARFEGDGPIGRLRAQRDALEECARRGFTAPTLHSNVKTQAASTRPSITWEHAALCKRLRDEGVLPPLRGPRQTPAPFAQLVRLVRARRQARERARRKKSQ